MDRLQSPGVTDLQCPSCGSEFGKELTTEGYSISPLGRRLITQSYWMTVWITKLLVDIGIPIESILWNFSESGEEIDVVVEMLGRLWIFELKDREFGAGDAYPLNYRQVRYKADKAVVVSTGKVSKDARRVFADLLKEGDKKRERPLYVEGLDAAEEVLRQEVERLHRQRAFERIIRIGMQSGYDLRPILEERYGSVGDIRPDGNMSDWAMWELTRHMWRNG